jgi:hypothetical protein
MVLEMLKICLYSVDRGSSAIVAYIQAFKLKKLEMKRIEHTITMLKLGAWGCRFRSSYASRFHRRCSAIKRNPPFHRFIGIGEVI